ncbi:MAG TPA: hypothetical protein VEH04_04335 [Verrucomicrobiae bacterium]|nr:hypothetical protein [Verrucomicrobiae bacterium]
MTVQEAKEILRFYRPGTADAEDAEFNEALQLCEERPELKEWFDAHCAVYSVIRDRMRGVAVPEGLAQQIIAERKIQPPRFPTSKALRVLTAAAAIAITCVALMFLRGPAENTGFTGFRERMIGTALRSYAMDLHSEDSERIRAFLATERSIADYVLPEGLKDAKPIGCVATTWQGEPVSMICFRSGNPPASGRVSDVWMFVTATESVRGAPKSTTPIITTFNNTTAASWTDGDRTYLLAVEGDETMLRRFL